MKDIIQTIDHYIKSNHLFEPKDPLLIAISGGLDSVVLTHILLKLGYPLTLAHVNFGLRGVESDTDEDYVRELAKQLQLPVHVHKVDTKAFMQEHKLGVQAAARKLRYDWFDQLLADPRIGAKYLVTAHHADDQVETIFMHFMKGTGLKGLLGIPRKQGKIRRPLLSITRKQIEEYAHTNNIQWREDASNHQQVYLRNAIRLEVLPILETIMPSISQNILHLAERMEGAHYLYDRSIQLLLKKLIVKKGEEIHLPIHGILRHPAAHAILFEVMYPLGFSSAQIQEAYQLLFASTGKHISSSTHMALVNRNWLMLIPHHSNNIHHVLIEEPGVYDMGDFQLDISWSDVPNTIPSDKNIAYLDARDISFPLLARRYKTGDYFYPLGMNKKQKLSDFFINQKMPLHEKERTWLMTSNDRIAWIIGQRIDHRFRLQPSSSKVLRCLCIPKNGRVA